MIRDDQAIDAEATGFACILNPVSVDEYIRQFINGESLFVEGSDDKFDFIINQKRIFDAIRRAHGRKDQGQFSLSALEPDILTGETQVSQPITPDEIESYLSRGIPICVNDLGVGDRDLTRFGKVIGRDIGLEGDVRFNCYISSGSAETRTHIDSRATHSIQILGSKTWHYAPEATIPWPRSTAQVDPEGKGVWMMPGLGLEEWESLGLVEQDDFKEVCLNQGDFLFVPSGAWHSVRSEGDSIAINISIRPKQYTNIIASILQTGLKQNPFWRAGLPPGTVTDQTNATLKAMKDGISILNDYIVEIEMSRSKIKK